MNKEDRIKFLQHKMNEFELCGAVLIYSRDILYYTGTAQPSYLVICLMIIFYLSGVVLTSL